MFSGLDSKIKTTLNAEDENELRRLTARGNKLLCCLVAAKLNHSTSLGWFKKLQTGLIQGLRLGRTVYLNITIWMSAAVLQSIRATVTHQHNLTCLLLKMSAQWNWRKDGGGYISSSQVCESCKSRSFTTTLFWNCFTVKAPRKGRLSVHSNARGLLNWKWYRKCCFNANKQLLC